MKRKLFGRHFVYLADKADTDQKSNNTRLNMPTYISPRKTSFLLKLASMCWWWYFC